MNGYSSNPGNEIFTREELKLWREVTDVVQRLPENMELRCHELVRAVHNYFIEAGRNFEVVDGKFGLVDHSWLATPRGRNRHTILDVYAVGSVPMVQLIDAASLGVRDTRCCAYVERARRSDIDGEVILRLLLEMERSQKLTFVGDARSSAST